MSTLGPDWSLNGFSMMNTLVPIFVLINADSECVFRLDGFTVECYLLVKFDLLMKPFSACAPLPVSDSVCIFMNVIKVYLHANTYASRVI